MAIEHSTYVLLRNRDPATSQHHPTETLKPSDHIALPSHEFQQRDDGATFSAPSQSLQLSGSLAVLSADRI